MNQLPSPKSSKTFLNTLQDFMCICSACRNFFLDFTVLYKHLNRHVGFNFSCGISQCCMSRHFSRWYFVLRRHLIYQTCRLFWRRQKKLHTKIAKKSQRHAFMYIKIFTLIKNLDSPMVQGPVN